MNAPQKFFLFVGAAVALLTVFNPPWTEIRHRTLYPDSGPVRPFSNAPHYAQTPQQVVDSQFSYGPFQHSIFNPPTPGAGQSIIVNWGQLLAILAGEGILTAVLCAIMASKTAGGTAATANPRASA